MVKEIQEKDFEKEVIEAGKPVVADFWAPWCGYCRRLAPMYDRLEAEHGDKIAFVKVNVDDNAALAGKYGVTSIPTLILFDGGKAKAEIVSPESQADAEKWLKDNGAL